MNMMEELDYLITEVSFNRERIITNHPGASICWYQKVSQHVTLSVYFQNSFPVALTPFSEPFFCCHSGASVSLTPFSNACQVARISLCLDRVDQRITGNAFWNSLHSDWQIDTGYFNMPIIMARTQILIHRWGPRTRTLALFRRRT